VLARQAADVIERTQARSALRESEARFRNMADHSPVMVWVTEPDGRCTFVAKSWYDFTGQAAEAGLGFGWLEAVHPRTGNPPRRVSSRPTRGGNRSAWSTA
jgi:PAS domain S-box-containing protein